MEEEQFYSILSGLGETQIKLWWDGIGQQVLANNNVILLIQKQALNSIFQKPSEKCLGQLKKEKRKVFISISASQLTLYAFC